MIDELNAYAAGLVDGEGSILCLGQGPQRPHQPEVSIGMTTPECLSPLLREYGGFLRVSKRHKGRQNMHVWRVKGAGARGFLCRTQKFLVMERRKECARLLTEEWPRTPNRRDPGSVRGYREATAALAERLHAVNIVRQEWAPQDARVAGSLDFAYLAGILDGEGHVRPKGRGLEVFSTDPELIAWLQARWPGRVTHYAAKGNRRAQHRWFVNGTIVRETLLPVTQWMQHKNKVERMRATVGGNLDSWVLAYLPAAPLAVAKASGRSFPVVYTELGRLERLGVVRKLHKEVVRGPGRNAWVYGVGPVI